MDVNFDNPAESTVSKGGAKKQLRKSAIKSDFDTPTAKKSVKIKGPADSSDDEDNSQGDAAPQNASPAWDVNADSSPEAKGGHFDDSDDADDYQTHGNNNDDDSDT